MILGVITLVLLGFILALASKSPILRILARLFCALIALASGIAAVWLIGVGNKVHWTSDGPGMLFVMIAIGLFGLATFFFGALALGPSRSEPSAAEADKPIELFKGPLGKQS